MDLGIPPRMIKNPLESNLLKSRFSVCELTVPVRLLPGQVTPAQKGPAGLQIPLSAVWSQGPSVASSTEELRAPRARWGEGEGGGRRAEGGGRGQDM